MHIRNIARAACAFGALALAAVVGPTPVASAAPPSFSTACSAWAEKGIFRNDDALLMHITNVVCVAPPGWQLVAMDRTTYYGGHTDIQPLSPLVSGKLFTGVARAQCSPVDIVLGLEKRGSVTVNAMFQSLYTGACVPATATKAIRGRC